MDQILLQIIDVIRSNLSPSIQMRSSAPLTEEQVAALRPAIMQVVAATVVSATGGDMAAVVSTIADGVLAIIAKDPTVLTPTAGASVRVDGVEAGGITGHTSIKFSGSGRLSGNVDIVLDASRPERVGLFKSAGLMDAIIAGLIVSAAQTTVTSSSSFIWDQITREQVAVSVVVTADDVRLRAQPSLDAEILWHLNKGARGIQIAEDGEWRQIVFEKQSGWVHGKFVMKVE